MIHQFNDVRECENLSPLITEGNKIRQRYRKAPDWQLTKNMCVNCKNILQDNKGFHITKFCSIGGFIIDASFMMCDEQDSYI